MTRNPRELPGQLLGRLPANLNQNIDRLCSQASAHKSFPWLKPLTSSLAPFDTSLIRTLQSHTDSVNSVAISPDGLQAISGSSDRTVLLFDLESGQTLTFQGHTDWVKSVAISPDGLRAISGSWDKTLRVWDLESRQTLRTLQGHTASVSAVAISSDGRLAVSGSDDGTLRVWDLESGQLLKKLIGHTGGVVAVATSSDGRLAVSGSLDKTLRVWDLNDGKELVTCIVDVQVTACAMSHDSRTIVSGDRFGRVHFLRLEGVD